MSRRVSTTIAAATLFLATWCFLATPAQAHFGMVIPDNAVVQAGQRSLGCTFSFSHPFEMVGMELVKPKAAFLVANGKKTDLLGKLKPAKIMDHGAWTADIPVKRPGVYQIAMEPTPYWEPAEDCSIIHYTKTVVSVYGDDVGWDEPLGLKTEIIPMLRPFGNYAGNAFVGKVVLDGKPVPGAEVEVEFYNAKGAYAAPSDLHVTQVVLADENGVFSFTCPLAGWWGFAALNTADFTLADPSGTQKPVEIGAVLWTYFAPYGK